MPSLNPQDYLALFLGFLFLAAFVSDSSRPREKLATEEFISRQEGAVYTENKCYLPEDQEFRLRVALDEALAELAAAGRSKDSVATVILTVRRNNTSLYPTLRAILREELCPQPFCLALLEEEFYPQPFCPTLPGEFWSGSFLEVRSYVPP